MGDLDTVETENYRPLLYKNFNKDNLPERLTLRVPYGRIVIFGAIVISIGLFVMHAAYLSIQKGEDVFQAYLAIILCGGFSIYILLCTINPAKLTLKPDGFSFTVGHRFVAHDWNDVSEFYIRGGGSKAGSYKMVYCNILSHKESGFWGFANLFLHNHEWGLSNMNRFKSEQKNVFGMTSENFANLLNAYRDRALNDLK